VISLICPAWNAAATLAETLRSVAAQTAPVGEIIVIDDGSTDATGAIAAAHGARVLRQEQQGPAAALNAGIAASRGDILAFLDADDLWPAGKLALQARILAEDPMLDGVFGQVECFLCPSVPPDQVGRFRVEADPVPAWLLGALLIRRASFERAGDFSADMAAGYFIDWCDRARRAGLRLAMRDALVLRRRIHPGSLSHRTGLRDSAFIKVARAAIARRRTETGAA
jgi:glycosyltransferase involved in cell wall biosynthesis